MSTEALKAQFPREKIHWRAQSVTKAGDKAMALAYLDARDVMDRLDDVFGAQNWQTEHIDCGGGKLACRIGLKIDNEWVWKSDGAGSTDIEAEKGAFSTSFKRAAVAWGIGRYLYDMPQVWAPCESYKQGDRWKFSKFIADPWQYVKGGPAGDRTERGPKGGRAKPEINNNTLVLNVGKEAHSYPIKRWRDIGQFITDLGNAVEVEREVWDVNSNSIEKARAKLTEGKQNALISKLCDIEILAGGGQNMRAG